MQAWRGFSIYGRPGYWGVKNAAGYTMQTASGIDMFRTYAGVVEMLADCYAVEIRREALRSGMPYLRAAEIHQAAKAECIAAHTSEPRRVAA